MPTIRKITSLKNSTPVNRCTTWFCCFADVYIFILELPETSFTRSISNPEAVMRRRRQQKLEKKLQQFRSRDGGPDTGGTLKIYGESLCRDVPYKTLLLSIRDCAQAVVREMLAKYGMDKADPLHYCLVQVRKSEVTSRIKSEILFMACFRSTATAPSTFLMTTSAHYPFLWIIRHREVSQNCLKLSAIARHLEIWWEFQEIKIKICHKVWNIWIWMDIVLTEKTGNVMNCYNSSWIQLKHIKIKNIKIN